MIFLSMGTFSLGLLSATSCFFFLMWLSSLWHFGINYAPPFFLQFPLPPRDFCPGYPLIQRSFGFGRCPKYKPLPVRHGAGPSWRGYQFSVNTAGRLPLEQLEQRVFWWFDSSLGNSVVPEHHSMLNPSFSFTASLIPSEFNSPLATLFVLNVYL